MFRVQPIRTSIFKCIKPIRLRSFQTLEFRWYYTVNAVTPIPIKCREIATGRAY